MHQKGISQGPRGRSHCYSSSALPIATSSCCNQRLLRRRTTISAMRYAIASSIIRPIGSPQGSGECTKKAFPGVEGEESLLLPLDLTYPNATKSNGKQRRDPKRTEGGTVFALRQRTFVPVSGRRTTYGSGFNQGRKPLYTNREFIENSFHTASRVAVWACRWND